jgi:hypothetical protein
MDEIWRVLKHGGIFKHRTPSSDGRGAFQDPYHKSFWNINTWKFYFTDPAYRELYRTKANFNILRLEDVWSGDNVIHTHCIYAAVKPGEKLEIAVGCTYDDIRMIESIVKQSDLGGMVVFAKYKPESATKGLNEVLGNIEKEAADIAILTHQDMFFPVGWMERFAEKISQLPDSWIVAGVWGIDKEQRHCGAIYDRRKPGITASQHDFPVEVIALDECCLVVNMKSGFRFDEGLEGFHLYGIYAALRAQEMGGTVWVIDCPPEHYTRRTYCWKPDGAFEKVWEWLKQRFPDKEICSPVYKEETDAL